MLKICPKTLILSDLWWQGGGKFTCRPRFSSFQKMSGAYEQQEVKLSIRDSKWPFDPLFGGHQQPFKGSRIRTPQKGHQQNCQLFLFSLIFVEPAHGIFIQDFLDILFGLNPFFWTTNFVVDSDSNKNRPYTILYPTDYIQSPPPEVNGVWSVCSSGSNAAFIGSSLDV